MIVWDRNKKHEFMSVDDRYKFVRNKISYFKENVFTFLNISLNIIVPFLIYCIFGFNLFVFALSYIVFDCILILSEQIIFVSIPYIIENNMTLSRIEKRAKKSEKLDKKFNEKIKSFKSKKCSKCTNYNCSKCFLIKDYKWKQRHFYHLFNYDQDYIKQERAKIAEDNISKDNKLSKDYEDKREYFLKTKEKLDYYLKNYNMNYLSVISDSLDKLSDIINHKPIGITLIPASTYIYLDELLNILNKISSFDDEKRILYEDDVTRISNKLSDNIHYLTERIDKIETEDIDVSISVLLKELTNLEENHNV